MDTIQRALVSAHEYIHFVLRHSASMQNDFLALYDTFISPAHLKGFFEAGIQHSGVAYERFVEIVANKRFYEEVYCDFRAANYTHLYLTNQLNKFGRILFSRYEFFLAILSYFVNLNLIGGIDFVVDQWASHNGEISSEEASRQEARSLEFNVRRMYMRRQLQWLGEYGTGEADDLKKWTEDVKSATLLTDHVAEQLLYPSFEFVSAHPIPLAFNVPVGKVFHSMIFDEDRASARAEIMKLMVDTLRVETGAIRYDNMTEFAEALDKCRSAAKPRFIVQAHN